MRLRIAAALLLTAAFFAGLAYLLGSLTDTRPDVKAYCTTQP